MGITIQHPDYSTVMLNIVFVACQACCILTTLGYAQTMHCWQITPCPARTQLMIS